MRPPERSGIAVATRLACSAHEFHGRGSVEETLRAIVERARGVVGGSDHAGVTLLDDDGTIHSPAYTDPLVPRLDRLQAELDQGPCLAAMRGEALLRIDDTARDRRWPDFARAADALGIGSTLACRISTGPAAPAAALNLHADRPSAFDDDTVQIAALYAVHAATALADAGLVESLHRSMDRRQTIGEATGILMERHRFSSRQAFDLLVTASQRLNVKLRDIAAHVVATGEDPRLVRREQLPPASPR
jgi:GAF domain-containing protein